MNKNEEQSKPKKTAGEKRIIATNIMRNMKIKDKDRLIARMLTTIAVASWIGTAGLGINMLINQDKIEDFTDKQNIAYQTAVTASSTIAASSTMMAIPAHHLVKHKKQREINTDTHEDTYEK